MSTHNPEKRREYATHRYEICSEDSYRPYINKVGILISIYKYCFLRVFWANFFDRRLKAELTWFTKAQ